MKKTRHAGALWSCLLLALIGQGIFSVSFSYPILALAGIACFAVAGRMLAGMEAAQGPEWRPAWLIELGILAAILALGLALRLYRLDTLPDGGFRDEGQSGMVATQMLQGEAVADTGTNTPLFLTLVPTAYFYPMALIFKLLGISLFGVRLDSVIFGMLSIAAFYFLARRLLGVGMGLCLAFCLAALRWHLNFSRIGLLGIITFFIQIPFAYFLLRGFEKPATPALKRLPAPLLALAGALALLRIFLSSLFPDQMGGWDSLIGLLLQLPGIVCLAWALKEARSRLLVFAAAILGLSFYTYAAAYLLVPFCLAWTAYALLRNKAARLEARREWLKPLALACLSFLIFAGPMLNYYFSHSARVNGRPQRISIFQHDIPGRDPSALHAFGLNLAKTMGMENIRGDNNPRHNLPNAPMLNAAWAAAFALGVALCLWQAWQPLPFLLLLWWQCSLLGGYFSIEAPQAYRTMDVIVPVLLIMGLALKRLWQQFKQRLDPWLAGPILVFLFFGLGALYEGYVFFGRQTSIAEYWSAFSGDESEMGRDYRATPQGTHALVRPDWLNSFAFKFMAYPYVDYEGFDPSLDIPPQRTDAYRGKNVLYILDEGDLPLKEVLKGYYPLGQYREARQPSTGQFLYWTFFVPGSETQAAIHPSNGLTGRYFADLGETWGTDWKAPHWQQKNLRLTRMDPIILFHWTIAPITERFYSVEWTGRINIPQSGEWSLSAMTDDYASIDVDGKKLAESPIQPSPGGWVEGGVRLSKGKHAIRLRYYESKNTARIELWWRAPGQEKRLVPMEALFPK
jgi:hypothetical protein